MQTDKFKDELNEMIQKHMQSIRQTEAYKHQEFDNLTCEGNKYFLCGVIHGMRTAMAYYTILKRRKNAKLS